jgi:hypothetical protein
MDAVKPTGALERQVERALYDGCADAKILEHIPAAPLLTGRGLRGAAASARVRVTFEGQEHEEGRVFAMFEGESERLPVVFLGELAALPFHRNAMESIFESIHALDATESLY